MKQRGQNKLCIVAAAVGQNAFCGIEHYSEQRRSPANHISYEGIELQVLR